jgi:hypothetical protein
MARKNQRLINYHTSGLTSMPLASDVHYGEIVVRHNEQQPELLIKVSESEFGVIPGSGAVASAISVAVKNVTDYIDGEVNTIEGSIAELQEAVSGISTDIGENYVSNEAFKQAQEELFDSATTVASADATAKVNAAKEELNKAITAATNTLQNKIDAVDEKADANAQALADYKTEVSETYETKENVASAITDAKDAVYASATTVAAADAEAKANAAKTDAINAAAASAKTLNSGIEAVDGRVDTVSGNLDTFKTEVAKTYETKTNVATAITAAKDAVYASATTVAAADAEAKANAAKTDAINAAAVSANTLLGMIDGVDDKVDADVKALADYKTEVSKTYETKENVTSAITDAKDAVYASATTTAAADAQSKANAAKTDAINAAAASAKTLSDKIDGVDGKVDTLSGNVHTTIENLESALTETINNKVSTAYRFQGSCKYAELASKEKVNGYVWNVTDAHGNTPAGTNYAWSEDTQTWDALGGTIDLSPYALKTEVTGATNTLQNNIDAANDRIDVVSGNLDTFKTEVANTYETKLNVASAITDAKSAVYASATTTAAADAQSKANAAKTDAINAAAASAKTLSDAIAAVDDNLDALSGVTKTVKATADSAVQTASVDCGASVKKEGTELKFSFAELIIDCGDF